MEGRAILLGDFNANSPEWNLHCGERRDATGLETLIERHELILNNELGKTTGLTHQKTKSIIDLMFNTHRIGVLDSWIIDQELSPLSDHEVIVCELANLNETIEVMRTSQEVIGWSVNVLSDETRKEACKDWHQAAAGRP